MLMTKSVYYDLQSYVLDNFFTIENYYRLERQAKAPHRPLERAKKASAAQ